MFFVDYNSILFYLILFSILFYFILFFRFFKIFTISLLSFIIFRTRKIRENYIYIFFFLFLSIFKTIVYTKQCIQFFTLYIYIYKCVTTYIINFGFICCML